ncbi:hypothetical protein CPB84DRAFT_1937048 [Gymnopilus junonius]|uniref:UBC core domain-containing protein n=1 Tax=Gymnopilus junonius TaxID=109634 RepID=A0A9P5NYV4_GYMJU|nr:hypothetical protein CPB84DRAFT_1937048 [Gymnopilus junonius]
MPTTRASKRNSHTQTTERPTKRSRKTAVPELHDIIVIESDSEDEPEIDEEMKDILAQIKAQEDSESLARRLQNEYSEPSSSSGSRHAPIVVEDDTALARKLAEEWSREDNEMDASTTVVDIEIVSGPSHAEKQASRTITRFSDSEAPMNRSFTAVQPNEALESFKEVFTRTRSCSKCHEKVNSPRGCVMFSETSLPPSMTHLLHAPCSSCRTNHCRGCFSPISCTPACKGPSKNPKCSVVDCCANVRAIAIFETLGGFDRQFITERAAAESRALALSNGKSNAKGKSVGPGGTGYGLGVGVGADFFGYLTQQRTNNNTSGQPANLKHKKDADHWDTVVLRTLNILVSLLPAPYADDANVYDMLPHASIGHLISLSQVPTLLADLLRNDSVTDWISRKDIYNAMLSLLRRMADCELTIHSLIAQRWEIDSTCGLEKWMWNEGEITWKSNNQGEIETASALHTYFTKLTKQSEAFLAGATQMLNGDDADAEVEEMVIQGTSLCCDIIAARDDLERAIAILGQPTPDRENRTENIEDDSNGKLRMKKGKGKGKEREVSIDFDKAYAEACEKLAFKHVSLAEPHSKSGGGLAYVNYNYTELLNQTQNSTRLPKDRLHLLKELAVMATSLPPGVWVRIDEVRNDAIKIMIAGPDGTPYAGGLFEFDCLMPVEYPAKPPLMHLRTTGGGSVRFNPNLYNEGKVCLSLLGTWSGRQVHSLKQWTLKSTLLQVLVSIQSMILVDAPYFNEPAYGQAYNLEDPASIAYNRNISMQTTRWAIVDWLDDKHRNGIWRDIIASHFTIRKHKIREQIVEWSKAEPRIRAYSTSLPLYGIGYNYQMKPKPTNARQGMDLLEEFDKGIQIAETWLTREDGA